jgi:hypothetical protein
MKVKVGFLNDNLSFIKSSRGVRKRKDQQGPGSSWDYTVDKDLLTLARESYSNFQFFWTIR